MREKYKVLFTDAVQKDRLPLRDQLKITARAIYEELIVRGIKTEVVDTNSGLMRYHMDDSWHFLRSCSTEKSSHIGTYIANRKLLSSKIIEPLGVRISECIEYSDEASARQFLSRYGQIVVKPNDAAHGDGVTVGVSDEIGLREALDSAREHSGDGKILLQRQVQGFDVRFLIIGGMFVAASVRTPAQIVGDGHNTVRALIEKENSSNLQRGINYSKPLNVIDLTAADRYLGAQMDDVIPPKGTVVRVTGTANIGTGGKAKDATEVVPLVIIEQAQKVARELGLQCCGVDFLTTDIANDRAYYFIEVNASPSFGLHMQPSEGLPRYVQKTFVDMLLHKI